MLALASMLLILSGLMLIDLWATNPLIAIAAFVAGAAATMLAGWFAVRLLWPRRLEITATGGTFYKTGHPALTWQWSATVDLTWQRPSDSRFAPEEPMLRLNDDQMIPLDPFGPEAYQAVRERTLLHTLHDFDQDDQASQAA